MTRLEKLQQAGIRRVGTPKQGFAYEHANGNRTSKEERQRIKALKIPPAWTEVFINVSSRASLQAIGKDMAGRWQYLYHETHRKRQEQKKFERLMQFAAALPRMRKAVARDIALPGLGREKVMACILRILSTCFIRPGSQVYAAENGSYGLATLRRKHVKIEGDLVIFDFRGKHGQQQHRELRDHTVAQIVQQLADLPGYEVFKYTDEQGNLVDVKRRHINQYIKEVMGQQFSAKDFRTWAGTLICACALARAEEETRTEAVEANGNKRARQRAVVAAIKEAAEQLGNTPAVCKSSYINPTVLDRFERGEVIKHYFHNVEELIERQLDELHPSEKALLKLLEEKAA
ncbi:MAG: topoisomerase [Blastocatellia bacterium]|jgi:DNA topoisomerase-1|nr:topoisomerase [Blastocatellia bacterium]